MTAISTRREALAVLAATAALPTMIGSAAANPETGKPAPDFTAADSKGKPHSLTAYKGKTVVLEWTNHECPYTVKHYATGNMQALQKAATGSGVIWLTLVSSRPGTQGHVNALEADKLTDDRNAHPTAVLLDANGDVGRLYGARTTPHMFVIDPAGMLVYMGAIDDQPTANHASVKMARNYVREALDAVGQRRPVAMAATRPYGCTIKY
jgi:Redoxin